MSQAFIFPLSPTEPSGGSWAGGAEPEKCSLKAPICKNKTLLKSSLLSGPHPTPAARTRRRNLKLKRGTPGLAPSRPPWGVLRTPRGGLGTCGNRRAGRVLAQLRDRLPSPPAAAPVRLPPAGARARRRTPFPLHSPSVTMETRVSLMWAELGNMSAHS